VTGPLSRAPALALVISVALVGCVGSDEDDTGTQRERRTPVGKHAPVEPTSSGANVMVTVTDQERQKIDGWGASIGSDTFSDPQVVPPGLPARELRRLDRLVFRTAGINLLRVSGPGLGTALETGDVRLRASDPRLGFMRRARRYGVRLMLTGADAPASMKAGQELLPGKEDAYAGFLAGILRMATRAGAPFSYVAIANEPSHVGSLLRISPEQAARVYAALVRRIRALGLRTRLVVGDDVGWAASLGSAAAALSSPGVRAAASVVASHAYGRNEEAIRRLAELARGNRLRVWQTEWSMKCPGDPPEKAMRCNLVWAEPIVSHMVVGGASAWFTIKGAADSTHGAEGALVVRQRGHPTRPFFTTKRFHLFRQYTSAAPPGSRRLEVTTTGGDLRALAFRKAERLAVVLTNASLEPLEVALDLGDRSGAVSARRTSATEDFLAVGAQPYEGRPIQVSLPPESVTTYALR
jgi:O-glycosyl hydrolase